jgi:hypothetical protein
MFQASIMEYLMLCRAFRWNGSASWHPQQPYIPLPYLSKFSSLDAIGALTSAMDRYFVMTRSWELGTNYAIKGAILHGYCIK